MSKNIYRVNKKSDLDEIMQNNFLKPVCIIFVSKSADTKLFSNIVSSVLAISKQHTYNMIVLIDFDDFLDNTGFFDTIKTNLPFFLSFFRGKNITSVADKDNFIPLVINKLEEIHHSYVNRLTNAFNKPEEQLDNNNNNTQTDKQENPVNISENQPKEKNKTKSKKNKKDDESLISEKSNKSNKSNKSSSSESSESSKKSSSSESSNKSSSSESSRKSSSSESSKKSSSSESSKSNASEKIKKDKEKLKKLKELQKLQSMLNK